MSSRDAVTGAAGYPARAQSASSGWRRRLGLGATFGMKMRFKLPYHTRNRGLEFDENRLISRGHFGWHRWRYELEPVIGGAGPDKGVVSTLARGTFDCSTPQLASRRLTRRDPP